MERLMNNKELQAARKLLMLDESEAAEHIGGVSPRTWQYWESGRNAVPEDVAYEVQALLTVRGELAEAIAEALPEGDELIELPFHSAYETFLAANPGKNKVDWRMEQSIAALFYTDGLARLA